MNGLHWNLVDYLIVGCMLETIGNLINKISPIRDELPQTVCGHPHNSIGKWIEL